MSELSPSGIRRVMSLAQEKERSGANVVHMEVGQPHFDTPPYVLESVRKALGDGIQGYTPNLGLPGLREAIAEKVSLRLGSAVSPASVCVTSGAVMALALAIQATVDPGDEVLVPDPGWPNYRSAVAVAGGTAVPYRLDPQGGFSLDVGEIERHLTSRTRLIILNSPGNPTGVVANGESIESVKEFAAQHNLYVLSDEIYEDIVYRGSHHSVLVSGLTDHTLMVSGVSKSYAMTGWRIGWLVASEPFVHEMGKLIEPLTSCPATVSQIAAEAALRGPQDFTAMMRQEYGKAFATIQDILGPMNVIPAEPGGAFYLMLDVSGAGLSSDELVLRLLEEEHVAVAPGGTFGRTGEGYIRISTALSLSDLDEGCRRIRRYLERSGG